MSPDPRTPSVIPATELPTTNAPVTRDTPRPGIADVARLHGMTVTGQPLPTVAEARWKCVESLARHHRASGKSENDSILAAEATVNALCAAVRRERDTEHLALIALVREWQEAHKADTESHYLDAEVAARVHKATHALKRFPLPTPETK